MLNELIKELLLPLVTIASGIIAVLVSKIKLTRKNNNLLKIVDGLMLIAEHTGLQGEDKKTFVFKVFEKLKIGKIDNIEEYINDKIKLANTINIKSSEINNVVSNEINKFIEHFETETNTTETNGDISPIEQLLEEQKEMVQLEMMLDQKTNELISSNERINELLIERTTITRELNASKVEVDRLKEVEIHLATKSNLANKQLEELQSQITLLTKDLEISNQLVKTREAQLTKLRGE